MFLQERPDLMEKWSPKEGEPSRFASTYHSFSWNPDEDERTMSDKYRDNFVEEVLRSPTLSKMFTEDYVRETLEYAFIIFTGEEKAKSKASNQSFEECDMQRYT